MSRRKAPAPQVATPPAKPPATVADTSAPVPAAAPPPSAGVAADPAPAAPAAGQPGDAAPKASPDPVGAASSNSQAPEGADLDGLKALGLLGVASLTDPAEATFESFVRSLLESAASAVGVTFDEIAAAVRVILEDPVPIDDGGDDEFDPTNELGGDASGARTLGLSAAMPLALLGLPVLFREHDRRFNGQPFTPAIITRVHDDTAVNLMVLPDGGEPYPRLNVGYELELDPDALGRAWSHLKFPGFHDAEDPEDDA